MKSVWAVYDSKDKKDLPLEEGAYCGKPASYFRKEFELKKEIIRATLDVTSKGVYKVWLNGKEAEESYLNPGWTDYNKIYAFQRYDVTTLVQPGKNAVGAAVGDGWYSGWLAFYGLGYYGQGPSMIAFELFVEYSDGSEERIISDHMKAGEGEIRSNDILQGTVIDRNRNTDGFSECGFNDSDWEWAGMCAITENLVLQEEEPIREEISLSPEIIKEEGTVELYDFKQNMVGIIRASISGEKGAIIRFRYGEMLNMDGTLYVDNLRKAKATDYVVCDGNPYFFKPEFTYHGFRYMEVKVIKGKAHVSDIAGLVLHNDLKITGTFSCSSELVNKIWENTLWGQRGNFLSVPTDCPQRDERMGWTGDIQIFCRTAMYNMDCRKFLRKYLRDVRNTQREDGAIYDVAPEVLPLAGYTHNAWGDVIAVLPYMYYRAYGDEGILRENLAAAKAWVKNLWANSDCGVRDDGGYGDWLSVEDDTDISAMNTAYSAYSALLTAEMCKILEDPEEDIYRDYYQKFKRAFNHRFILENGKIKSDTQTIYLLAYAFDLVDKQTIKPYLLNAIRRKDNHLSTGFVGVKFLLPTLCDLGETELAYELITKTSYPSWGYSIVNGATTIWERWNSYTLEKGFEDISMNSFNHYSLGSCVEWMYEYMLGIKPASPGFSKIHVQPFIDGKRRITSVRGSYDSVSGKIEVQWRFVGSMVEYIIKKPKEIAAEFAFEHIALMEQDDKRVNSLSAYAEITRIMFKI